MTESNNEKGCSMNMTGQEYKIIPTAELVEFARRDIRNGVVSALKERISAGYNPARPITVIEEDGKYVVVDGNHRLYAARELNLESVPCLIRSGNKYKISIESNEDQDTYAPEDLFDKLDTIKALRSDGMTQAAIGELVGWSRESVAYHSALSEKVVTEVLNLAKAHQKGRVTEKVTIVTFEFTEGWFRNSGIYALEPGNQMALMEFVIAEKFPKNSKVSDYAAKLLLNQQAISVAKETLIAGADNSGIIENISRGLYKTLDQVRNAISKVNEQFLEKQKIQIKHQDCFDMLSELPNETIDCVITDPPYNRTPEEWDKFTGADALAGFIDKVVKSVKPKLKREYQLFMFASSIYMADIEMVLRKNDLDVKSRIVWIRRNIARARTTEDRLILTYDICFHCGTKPLNFPDKWGEERFDVMEFAFPQTNHKADPGLHPTQKPIELIRRIVELSSNIGDLVVDPFCGSGTTAKACEELNRKCITSDTNEEYVKIAQNRVFGGK